MRAIKAKVPRSVHTATRLDVADNTGARLVEIISVLKYRGRKNRMPAAGIGERAGEPYCFCKFLPRADQVVGRQHRHE
jgi:hypothetical protein